MLTRITKDVDQPKLKDFFNNLADRLGGGAPDEIKLIEGVGLAYVTFPSVLSAQKFFEVFQNINDYTIL